MLQRTFRLLLSGVLVYGSVTAAGSGRGNGARNFLEPIGEARAESGNRLKAEYLLGDDGSFDYQLRSVWWFDAFTVDHPVQAFGDSMRNEECAYQISADSKARCLPVETARTYVGQYSDAGCTVGVGYVVLPLAACPVTAPKYASSPDVGPTCQYNGGSAPPTHIYPITAPLGKVTNCYSLNNGVCTLVGNCKVPQTGPSTYYALGPEVDPANFVEGAPAIDP